jgi:chromosome segregation protein
MVHIKRVELSHFKSFGGTTQVPFLPGFTVISGPNGSGKSNILDALLFCLGLASSKGMRAERLPDLINHDRTSNGRTCETSVSVTFDLNEEQTTTLTPRPPLPQGEGEKVSNEWTVTRRLRVNKEGNYTSTYYINGQTSTVTELHQQLNHLRIYPEGYNVVLQGDVTRIITMNGRERREIIDELAGVAEFDRKIEQTKQTLESVREREERCQIIEQELVKSLEKLAADRLKAEKYQKLKATIVQKQQWEKVLVWRSLSKQERELEGQINAAAAQADRLTEQLGTLDRQIQATSNNLDQLNTRVKALGEEEQLSVASKLATQKAKRHQLQQRQQELETTAQQIQGSIARTESEIGQYRETLQQVDRDKSILERETIATLIQQRNEAREKLQQGRDKAEEIASASDAWVQEQAALSRQISALQSTLSPKTTERAQLSERQAQLEKKIAEQSQLLAQIQAEITAKEADIANLSTQITAGEQKIQSIAQQLAAAEQERNIQQETQNRLLQEQREKQRQLDKLEATKQAQQEAQGTYATKIILNANLPGICGLVAQLGQVEPRYQLALEIAAGARLGNIVVEDDAVAAAAIELLKQKKAGRATFLPLNKIQSPRFTDTVALRYAKGFIDLAVNLIDSQPRYEKIFAYVFGSTVVFETLNDARSYLGKYRIVTLSGELLESSGAMTGGSQPTASTLHFGTVTVGDSEEVEGLRRRLTEIEEILRGCQYYIDRNSSIVQNLSQELNEVRQQTRERQLFIEQSQKDIQRLNAQKEQLISQSSQNSLEIEQIQERLQILAAEIPTLEIQLQECRERLAELEKSQTHSEWQQIQTSIKQQEADLQAKEEILRQSEANLRDLENKSLRISEKISESEQRIQEYQKQQLEMSDRRSALGKEISDLEAKIADSEAILAHLSLKLEEAKQERDRAEADLKELQHQQQDRSWQLYKIQETQQEKRLSLENIKTQVREREAELPDPLPEIPSLISDRDEESEEENRETIDGENTNSISIQLEQLQKQIRNGQKRLEAMEPVNMLALEEYDLTQARLQELSDKLATLTAERTELLLRVENFTTLRCRAFKEAFDAVNENFQNIFATLSDGDGYLELEDSENPFNGGLNLIAHPKGKPVQRLSSMSGGEKSLTALSFIFALQRYRPSPFYAFDEVDMFLDGANVERLAKMIKNQAQQAQFIVVSLRRPTIESSQRTIGVTQARGAYTQVLGIKL